MLIQSNIQRIFPRAQNYQWGILSDDPNSLVYQLWKSQQSQEEFNPNPQPYAELWMGTHPNLKSLKIDGSPLETNLSYLFKVLSINQPLSIQIHPNKQQAELLHQTKPNLYPDDNHKPEMAIAITQFEALIGFANQETIIANIEKNPQLFDTVIDPNLWKQFISSKDLEAENILKQIVQAFLQINEEKLNYVLSKFEWPQNCSFSLKNKPLNNDVGYLFTLLMNHVNLKPGQAVVLEAGLIHAYIKGNIIEAMANSDNVVRCGFTPKPKDIQAMQEILKCKMELPNFVQPIELSLNHYLYPSQFAEFQCEYIKLDEKNTKSIKIANKTILLCIKGEGQLIQENQDFELNFGSTYFIEQECLVELKCNSMIELYLCHS